MAIRTTSRFSPAQESTQSLQFSLQNFLLAGAGIVVITVGYILLAGGSTTLAPILLVLGYVVLMPLAIIR